MKLPVVVTMIHGTFANGAEWTNDAKSFARARIQTQIESEVIFRAFNWTGSNSHTARIRAGQELAEDQAEVAQQYAGSPRFLLAHSHGGNVAYYALRSMPDNVRPTGIVTMGTPYIHCRQRDIATTRRLGPWILAFIAVSLLMPLAGILLYLLLGAMNIVIKGFWPGFEVPEVWLAIALIVIGLNSIRIPVWAYRKYSSLERWAARKQCEVLARLSLPLGEVPCMYVHVDGDEARFWLKNLAWLSNIPAQLWRRRTMNLILAAGCIGHLVGIVLGDGLEEQSIGVALLAGFPGAIVFSLATLLSVAFYGQVLMILMPFMTRAHRGGFGGEGLWCNWLVHIFAEPFPPVGGAAAVSEKSCKVSLSVARGLRHSWLYSDEEVLDSIGKWMKSQTREGIGHPQGVKDDQASQSFGNHELSGHTAVNWTTS